jgi:hypothetical protein
MSYEERLRKYEEEKKKLREENLTEFEYFRKIKALADKWRI